MPKLGEEFTYEAPPPPPPTGAPGTGLTLGDLYKLPEVHGLWFQKQRIVIDGYRFVACRFDGCQLQVASTNFEFVGCFIDDSTMIEYLGDISKPIKLFFSRIPWADNAFPLFVPTRHENGQFTIT